MPRSKSPDEAEILARSAPVAAAGSAVRRRFTATELADFMRCGLRYELLHLRGLPADLILSESRASERPPGHVVGSLLHEVIEKARGREGLSAALDRVIASNAAYAPIASALRRECAPILARFEKTALAARILSPDARRERQFSFLLDEYLLEGKIDALAGGDIVDFKSDDIEPSEAAAHAEAYRSQMDLYALACERLTGKAPERVALYFLRPGIEIAWNYGAAGLEAAASRVRETIGLIQNGPPYATAAGDACRCEYQTLCRFIARRRATR